MHRIELTSLSPIFVSCCHISDYSESSQVLCWSFRLILCIELFFAEVFRSVWKMLESPSSTKSFYREARNWRRWETTEKYLINTGICDSAWWTMRRVTPTAIDKLNLDRGENIYNGSLACRCIGEMSRKITKNSVPKI